MLGKFALILSDANSQTVIIGLLRIIFVQNELEVIKQESGRACRIRAAIASVMLIFHL